MCSLRIETIETTLGVFLASYSPLGLRRLEFPGGCPDSDDSPLPHAEWHALTSAAVRAILEGVAPGTLPPLDLSGHGAFRCAVWRQLRAIELGRTLSYGEVAERIGNPGGARAVGNACGANPIPLIIPCHRVLAAHGRLGGFSGGLDWKRKLLRIERIHVIDQRGADRISNKGSDQPDLALSWG